MPRQDDPHARLLRLPEYQELLDIMRADNPLIALGVTKREVCWTQFQAWLLNPIYHSTASPIHFANALLEICAPELPDAIKRGRDESVPEVENLCRLGSLHSLQVRSVQSARAEPKEGKKNRSDLVVQCDLGGQPLTILVENKIGAEEGDGQLARYVAERLRKLSEGEILLPVLLEIGDTPVGSASCPWAVCLDRQDADAWLSSGTGLCVKSGISTPSLVEHYRQVFRSWDLATSLNLKARTPIEELGRQDPAPPEWDLVSDLLKNPFAVFCREVRADPRLRRILNKLGFDEPNVLTVRGRLDVLQFTKPSWTICESATEKVAVNVHFEIRNPGELQIDIEITPYMPSSWNTPERRETLRPQLEAKSKLHRSFRDRFGPLSKKKNGLGVTLKRLHDPDKPGTCKAVKFKTGLKPDCTPAEQAAFVARALEKYAPVVDSLLEESGFK